MFATLLTGRKFHSGSILKVRAANRFDFILLIIHHSFALNCGFLNDFRCVINVLRFNSCRCNDGDRSTSSCVLKFSKPLSTISGYDLRNGSDGISLKSIRGPKRYHRRFYPSHYPSQFRLNWGFLNDLRCVINNDHLITK